MIGSVVDSELRLLRELGRGGTGIVYLAERTDTGAKSAIKVLQPGFAGDEELASRLKREGQVIARLAHPSIVRLEKIGQLPDGRLYLAMEFVEGEPLDQVLARGPLDPGVAVNLLLQIARAIDHAHSVGVVHRDLKPSNVIMLYRADTGQWDVKLLDFGIAKVIAPNWMDSVLSASGTVFGTPLYMAPEQITGTTDQPSIDIYALGCIAYHVLVGRPPFSGERLTEICEAHLSHVCPPPSQAAPGSAIPEALDRIVMCCLNKAPDRRFHGASALARALEQAASALAPNRQPSASQEHPAQPDPRAAFPIAADTQLTPRSAVDDTQLSRYTELVKLAHSLLLGGATSAELVVATVSLEDRLDQLALAEGGQTEINDHRDRLERSICERERRLKRALKQLARPGDPQNHTQPIRDLERRLVELGQEKYRRLDSIEESLERLRGEQERLWSELVILAQNLEAMIGQIVAAHLADDRIARAWNRLTGGPR